MVFHDSNPDLFFRRDLMGRTTYPDQKEYWRSKTQWELQEEFICPIEWKLAYLRVMYERKKIALTQRQSSESETPTFLTPPQPPNPQLARKGNTQFH